MKTFSLAFVFLFLSVNLAYCQFSINGSIKDTNGLPMPFANILLLQPTDSSLVKGVVSDETGNFSLQGINPGIYLVAGSMVGYGTVFSKPLSVANESMERLDFVLQEEMSELAEVVIQARKPLFEQQMDRLVVNVKNSIISSGSTVLEILARTPGITVNQQNNNISINGKEGVMVMLNDKMVRLPLNALVQMLSAMSADQVEKIEIITSPPARYDAEGNAGLINIVNSKSLELGTTGSFSGNMGFAHYKKGYKRFGGSFNLTHRAEKFSFYMDYAVMKNNFLAMIDNSQITDLPDKKYQSNVSKEKEFTDWNQNARIGMEYMMNTKTSLGTQFTAFSNKSDQLGYSHTEIILGDKPLTRINLIDRERNHWWNYAVNFNLTHHFTPEQTLSIDGDYLYFFHNNPHDYRIYYQYLRDNFEEEEHLVNSNRTPIHMWVSKIDYKNRINDNLSMEAGVKGFMSDVENKIIAHSSKEESVLADSFLNQHVLMDENIGAAYLSLDAVLDAKTKVQTGLRYEYTYTYLHTITMQPILKRAYGNFFPSFSISRDFNENSSLQFSYNHRITRPTFSDLAPFFTLLDPFTSVGGNMELLPSMSHSLQARFQFKKVYSVNFDFTHIDNFIHWDILVIPDQNIQRIRKSNFDHTRNISMTLSAPNNFTPWWEGQNSVQGVNQQVNSISQEVPINRSITYLLVNTTQSFKFGSGYSAELSGFYQSRSLAGLLTRKPFGSLNVGLQKELKDNKGVFKLSGEDLLWTLTTNYINSNAEVGFRADLDITLTSRMVRLTFSRNFGGKHVKSAKRQTGSEEERKRVL